MTGALLHVHQHTAKTFEHPASQFKFRVLGDGRVEPEILDSFSPSQAVTSIDDSRLQTLARKQRALDQAAYSKEETERLLKQQLRATLGENWNVRALGSRAEGRGLSYFHAEQSQAGAGVQTLYYDNRDTKLHLTTTAWMQGWRVDHSIKTQYDSRGTIDSNNSVESAHFELPGARC